MSTKLKSLLGNKRFVAIVGMLGSSGPGEAANAAAMATKMLAEAGLTWGELLQGGGAVSPGGRRGMDGEAILRQRLYAAQAAQEASETKARRAETANRELRKRADALATELHQSQLMVKSLEAALKKANQQRPKPKPAFGFPDAEEVADGESKYAGTTSVDFSPKPYREIKRWLDLLVKEGWDDLTDWETDFFTDFIDRKKGIMTERQYGIFVRTAAKTGLPLDF